MSARESDILRINQSLETIGELGRKIIPLAGDASTRTYYRAHLACGGTLIAMVMPTPGGNEEACFLDVQRFLEGLALPVPRVRLHAGGLGLVLLEDLGDALLESVVEKANQSELEALYRNAVDLLVNVRRATEGLAGGCCAFGLAFDCEKLMQEMRFFEMHFLHGLCRIEPSAASRAILDEFFSHICTLLAKEPRVFTHRDYHSRNLILNNGSLVMIDFQDARMGPVQYDLASLLRDSYVTLPHELVDELVEYYAESVEGIGRPSMDRFRLIFDIMSLQRNIKALGTFGYQVSVKGALRYLSSIPRTGRYVAENIAKYPELERFRPVVEDLVCRPVLELESKFDAFR